MSFDSGCVARGINYIEKSFMKWPSVANFIKLFWHNLSLYQHIALSFDSGCAARGINYIEKSFMKLTTGLNAIKLFSFVTDDEA